MEIKVLNFKTLPLTPCRNILQAQICAWIYTRYPFPCGLLLSCTQIIPSNAVTVSERCLVRETSGNISSWKSLLDCYLHLEYIYGLSLGHLVLKLSGRQNWEGPLLPSLVIPRERTLGRYLFLNYWGAYICFSHFFLQSSSSPTDPHIR